MQEGRYIDERISIVIPNVNATQVQGLERNDSVFVFIDAAPAKYTLVSNLILASQKGNIGNSFIIDCILSVMANVS